MMKQLLYFTFLLTGLFSFQQSSAEIGVGTETPQAALDITATDKGLLVPRIALSGANVAAPVTNPQGGALVNGTLVYNTATAGTSPNNVTPGFYYWENGQWLSAVLKLPYSGTTTGNGFSVFNTEPATSAVAGISTAVTGVGAGVVGQSYSTEGNGVTGMANSTTGQSVGVHGASSSLNGIGVNGRGGNNSGVNIGVQGGTNSPSGFGGSFSNVNSNGVALKTTTGKVQIDNLSGSGTRMVVAGADGTLSTQAVTAGLVLPYYAETTGVALNLTGTADDAYVISGIASAATGATIGVVGSAQSVQGIGVGGFASSTSGESTGVFGRSSSPVGIGVQGRSIASSGVNMGVYGSSNSPDGFGGSFVNINGGVALREEFGGVQFNSLSGTGTRMVVADAAGKLSTQPAGLTFPYFAETTGTGINLTSTGDSAYVISGIASATTGSSIGVVGSSQSNQGIGLGGFATSTSGESTGVFGRSSSTTGIGVQGRSIATSGINIGVYGSSASPDGFGASFINLGGGKALREEFGGVQFNSLSGTGTRMVVADADGNLSSQAIPTGGFNLPYTGTTAIGGSGGIFVTNTAAGGYGLFGKATTGTNGIGVLGRSESPDGTGVRGLSIAQTGNTCGVSGSASSPDGVGGRFSNVLDGLALQTLSGKVQLGTLSGLGSRMVITDAFGNLSAQAIPDGGIAYTAGSGINITGNAISATDNSATNEIQALSISGNSLSLSNGGGSVTLPSTSLTLPYSGTASNVNAAVFSVTSTGTTAAVEGSNNTSTAVNGTTTSGTALRGVASGSGSGVFAQSNTGTAGSFISSSGTAISALSSSVAGSFTSPAERH
ncbi:beta strand repeat-containing protein [Flavobacterium sp. 3HN19-14]|uniref:beta strand repeat-containing protein n=1 Tax=Flavobacterium sp. 3HN19-14 TaxID=3448133 RepID=UPI003EDF365E